MLSTQPPLHTTSSSSRNPLAGFASMIAAAAHLPLVPVNDWSTRAARALGAGRIATTVSIVQVSSGQVINSGGAGETLHAPLADLAATHPCHRDTAEALNTRPIDWADRHAHPFLDAGLPWGSVVGASRRLGPHFMLIVRQWSEQTERGAHELDAIDAAIDFIADAARPMFPATSSRLEWLSNKETEVLDQVALGNTVREIAEHLGRSPHTVHDHLKSIHRKTGISTRGALVAAASGRRVEQDSGSASTLDSAHIADEPSAGSEPPALAHLNA